MEITEKKTKVWNGSYKGVGFEINNWKTPQNDFSEEKDNWTYYIFIHLNRVTDIKKANSLWIKGKADNKGRVFYQYHKNNLISNIEFAGGCTWYSKESGFDGANKVIKIGCDYQHSWDEGYSYNLDCVKKDIEKSIDSFLNFIPDYKYWCFGNGNLYSLKDGILIKGTFYSKEYWGEKEFYKNNQTTN